MIDYNVKVTIPKDNKEKKQNDSIYIYYTVKKKWNSEKRQPQDTRVCVGKKIDETYMYPNDKYEIYFPNKTKVLLENKSAYSDSISVGQNFVINKVLDDLSLNDLLTTTFERHNLVKSLAQFYIDSNSSVSQDYDRYAYINLHFEDSTASMSTISRFYNQEISSETINTFLATWSKYIIEKNNIDDVIMSIDSTNMNVSSPTVEISEYGNPKVSEGLPQVNLAYALDQNTGLPIYYDLYPGSIIDNSHLKMMSDKAKRLGFRNSTFVLDRGYFSKGNLEYMSKNSFNYIVMAKSGLSCIEKLIKQVGLNIRKKAKFIVKDLIYGNAYNVKLFKDMKENHFVYLFYSETKAFDESIDYSKKIEYMRSNVSKTEKLTDEIYNTYKNYFVFESDDKDNILSIKTNEKLYDEYMESTGFFAIVSNKEMTPLEILERYKKQDEIEKTFRQLKTSLDLNKFRATSNNSLESKTLVSFIASIIRSNIKNKCKDYLTLYSSEIVPSILAQLSKIIISKDKGIYIRKYALTKKQKEILKCFLLDENSLDKFIAKINEKLSASI